MMDSKGDLFTIKGWMTGTVVRKPLFGKTRVEHHITSIQLLYEKNINTSFITVVSTNVGMEAFIDNVESCRCRFLKLSDQLEKFGFSLQKKIV